MSFSDPSTWDQMFQELIQEQKPRAKWTLQLDKNILPNVMAQGWKQYQQTGLGRFQCSICNRWWMSAQVKILCHMYWEPKKSRGQVLMRIFAQRCQKCSKSQFENPEFLIENIQRILEKLVTHILQRYYGHAFNKLNVKPVETVLTNRPHDRANCEACTLGSDGGCAFAKEAKPPESSSFPPKSHSFSPTESYSYSSLKNHTSSPPMTYSTALTMRHSSSLTKSHGSSPPMSYSTVLTMSHSSSLTKSHGSSPPMSYSTALTMSHSSSPPKSHGSSPPMSYSTALTMRHSSSPPKSHGSPSPESHSSPSPKSHSSPSPESHSFPSPKSHSSSPSKNPSSSPQTERVYFEEYKERRDTENERLWIYSWIKNIKFDRGRLPEISPMEMDETGDLTFQSTSNEVSRALYPEQFQGDWLR